MQIYKTKLRQRKEIIFEEGTGEQLFIREGNFQGENRRSSVMLNFFLSISLEDGFFPFTWRTYLIMPTYKCRSTRLTFDKMITVIVKGRSKKGFF